MQDLMKEIPKQEMVTVYSEDLDEEISGFICKSEEEAILLYCVDRFGEYDGYLLLETEGISRIDYGSFYEKQVQTLFNSKKENPQRADFSESEEPMRSALMHWAEKEKRTVTLDFWHTASEICGYIQGEEKNCFKLQLIDVYESQPSQGYSLVQLDNVKLIWADKRRARDAAYVYKMWEREGAE